MDKNFEKDDGLHDVKNIEKYIEFENVSFKYILMMIIY